MARQVVQFRKWGKSRVVTVAQEVWKELGWRLGDVLQLRVEGGELKVQRVFSPVQPAVKVHMDRPADEEAR